jgi:hypothetical protein
VALATADDCKDYLRVETTAEDDLFTSMRARVIGSIEQELGYPLTAAALTHTDYNEKDNYGQMPVLTLPGPFKTTSPAPVVTDVNGSTVDSATYDLDARGMKIRAKSGVSFSARPYSILATIGLSAHPDYATRLEAIANQAIVDFVAHLWRNRLVGVSSIAEEGGSAQTFEGDGRPPLIPDRVMESIDKLPGRSGGLVLA